MFRDVSFQLHGGEVMGLAGLVGAGRSELARAIVGIDAATAGSVTIDGRAAARRSPRTCQDLGLVYVPEDRHRHGIFLNLPNLYTMSAAILHRLGRPLMSAKMERTIGVEFVEQLRIKVSGLGQVSRTLSGGNQQKTVLAKSLVSRPKVVILDEPTRGIDARARVDVHALIHDLTEQGLGVLLISSDFEEVIDLSDRVLIMYHGELVEELAHSQCQIERVTAAAFGLREGRAV
jgi:AI-2 transport system ATP-binding protein